ncbi:MAG: vtpJ-therm [Haliea sp.]|uniref:pectin acetylesterase-family hydrolase n=1 Tax=Haliea sp. TaxID=1932666 RepID=UPI000C5D7156|nr:pectin acetylesterase-family hydrolase [Haliea sp.]MBM69235.1 vtpJ-therm [Haliea sp.]|tara:strand:- start:11398 stop:12543 length:1146 start_codon:yes stop_codon:yes gene_type:complete
MKIEDTNRRPALRRLSIALCAALPLLTACSDSTDSVVAPVEPPVEPAAVPFQELLDQGIARYLGEYTPMLSEQDGDVVNHSFGAGDGPLCLTGGEYTMATRDTGSEDLVIFLQGGGACWSDLCLATEQAAPGIPPLGVLDPAREGNPVAGWNTVYLPYCDGSLHAGDQDVDTDDDGVADRFHRGLHNLSASLDVAVNTFPAPRRILLTGSSAGGFGTTYALPLVRQLYPDVPIELINDSGLGLGRIDEPEFIQQLLTEWNATAFFPESCETCIGDDGHITDYHKYQLSEDENFRLGMMSYTRDTVIAVTFVQVGGEVFEEALLGELDDLEAAYPERVKSFVATGTDHTFLLGDLQKTAGGVSVADWISSMLLGEGWETNRD